MVKCTSVERKANRVVRLWSRTYRNVTYPTCFLFQLRLEAVGVSRVRYSGEHFTGFDRPLDNHVYGPTGRWYRGALLIDLYMCK